MKKAPSISSDENNSEFAIFKVEKVKKTVIGRSRVNSENNVFTLPIDNSVLHTNSIKNGKKCNRKYSMNIEFESKKIDLMTSPIKEPIKEQIFEDEEEEKEFKGNMIETNFIRHNTTGAKEINKFEENQLFLFEGDKDQMNLDQPSDFNMEINEAFVPQCNSLNGMEESRSKEEADFELERRKDCLLNMDVDMEDNFNPFNQHFADFGFN